jgi:alpha-ketoglutarate-dependent taurine dioxygenase
MDGFFTVLEKAVEEPRVTVSELGRELEEQQRRRKTMATQKRREKRFSKFKKVVPKAVTPSATPLVKMSRLAPDQPLPLVIEPATPDIDLVEWAEDHRDTVEEKLAEHGAILFRGFRIDSPPTFERFATAVCDELFHDNGEHPRESVSGNVATPVFYPPEEKLLWHNENTFNLRWPMKILFCCARPADEGGETPLVDSCAVFDRLRPEVREKFLEKQVMYARNYGVGLGLSWQEVFQVEDEAGAEAYCRENQIDFEWGPEGRLRTRAVRPAAGVHPKTGRMCWFNQAQHFHTACLDEATRRSMQAIYEEDEMPRNCYYGDGSVIEDSVMEEILEIYGDLEVSFPWQKGDVLVVDNMRVAHARNPFAGERKLLVAMGDVRRHESPSRPAAVREG